MWSRLSNAIASNSAAGGAGRLGLGVLLWLACCSNLARAQESPGSKPPTNSLAVGEIASRILQKAILQSVGGPPAYCIVRQKVHMFDKQLSGIGDYVRGGNWSGKLKFNLRMPAGDQLNTLLQVSDGQRLVAIEAFGELRRRTEVDLGKIRPRLILTNDSLQDPIIAMYLAIGGQAETLRMLYQQYAWTSVRDGQIGDAEVWWLTGKVPPQPTHIRSRAAIDDQLFADNNSGLLPTQVEIAIGKAHAAVPFWLYQVEQRREADDLSAVGRSAELTVFTEWASPSLLTAEQIPANLFDLPSSYEQLFDETEKYLPPPPNLASAPPGSPKY